jgi:hypothetical protein
LYSRQEKTRSNSKKNATTYFPIYDVRTITKEQQLRNNKDYQLHGVKVVAGSNPVTPTSKINHLAVSLSGFSVSTV